MMKREIPGRDNYVGKLVKLRSLFKTTSKEKGKCFKLIVDNGSSYYMVFLKNGREITTGYDATSYIV